MRRAVLILSLILALLAPFALPLTAATAPGSTAILTFSAQPVAQPRPGAWRIVRMSGGGERAEATLERSGSASEKAATVADLTRRAAAWAKAHSPAKLAVHPQGKLAAVKAEGHAPGSLTAFLATLDLRMDAWGALASFTGIAIGTETDGLSLGLLRRDAVHGDLTVSFTSLREEKGGAVAEVTLRCPPRITKVFIERQLADRAGAFQRATGAKIGVRVDLPAGGRP